MCRVLGGWSGKGQAGPSIPGAQGASHRGSRNNRTQDGSVRGPSPGNDQVQAGSGDVRAARSLGVKQILCPR